MKKLRKFFQRKRSVPQTKPVTTIVPDIQDPNSFGIIKEPKWHHLIVDDSESNRYIFHKYLDRINIQYTQAANGQEALDLVKQNPDKFDIIWMDIKMPVMDGIEATKLIRKLEYPEIIIIGLTGYIDIESKIKSRDAGMDFVVAKPIRHNVIVNYMKHLYNGHYNDQERVPQL